MRRFVLLFPVLFLLVSSATFAVTARPVDEIFQTANQAMQDGQYDQAVADYRSLLDAGLENGSLHAQLGQALFRQGKLGEALFQFLLAARLKPRDPDIEANLRYLRNHVSDRVEPSPQNPVIGIMKRIAHRMNRRENWIAFSILWFLCWALAAVRFFWPKELLRWSSWVIGAALLLLSITLLQKEFFERPIGVISSSEAKVYSGPGEGNVLLFELHEGTELSILERKEAGWLSIELADGKKGWVAATDVISEERI